MTGSVITTGSISLSSSTISASSNFLTNPAELPSRIGNSFPEISTRISVIPVTESADRKCSIV